MGLTAAPSWSTKAVCHLQSTRCSDEWSPSAATDDRFLSRAPYRGSNQHGQKRGHHRPCRYGVTLDPRLDQRRREITAMLRKRDEEQIEIAVPQPVTPGLECQGQEQAHRADQKRNIDYSKHYHNDCPGRRRYNHKVFLLPKG